MTSRKAERTRHLRQAPDVSSRGNLGWPKRGDPHGHGAWVVLVGVTPDQGGQESWSQGEAKQGLGVFKQGGARDAQSHNWKETHRQRKQALESHVLRKRACVVRRRAGGKGLQSQHLACGLSYFCLGIIGSRADAEQIRQEVRQFIEQDLRLSIAEEKSHIRHSKKGVTCVGYERKTYSGDRVIKLKRGTRHTTMKSISEQIQLHIPKDTMQKFCAQKGDGIYAIGKATHKPQWINLTDAEIILAYNEELRGLTNYYALAPGVKKTLHQLEWIWQTSLLKTLANKHKTSVNKIAKRLRTEEGLRLTVKREQETRSINVFRLKHLRKPTPYNSQLDVNPNGYIWTLSRSEVMKRLNRKRCEYCETTEGPFEVHHVRKLKDVAKGKVLWQRMMAARHRKTLILCCTCHHQLHAGTLPDKEALKKRVKGEPCAVTSRTHGSEGG